MDQQLERSFRRADDGIRVAGEFVRLSWRRLDDSFEAMLKQMDSGLRRGHIIIDTTTGGPQSTASLGNRLAERGVHYLEAPVSGSSEQARLGKALVIAAGEREVYDRCRDLFASFAAQSLYVGPWGIRTNRV